MILEIIQSQVPAIILADFHNCLRNRAFVKATLAEFSKKLEGFRQRLVFDGLSCPGSSILIRVGRVVLEESFLNDLSLKLLLGLLPLNGRVSSDFGDIYVASAHIIA